MSLLQKAGLFTTVVSVSFVESYKWLSPNPGDETVQRLDEAIDLITQASNRFYNYSQGIPVQKIVPAKLASHSSRRLMLSRSMSSGSTVWSSALVARSSLH